MGMITSDPSIADDYSAEIIRLARERSPAIDAWIVEERYLTETLPDNLSPMWLRNRCVIKLCEELADIGLRVHRDPDDICDDPALVYLVLALRAKFDDENLYELLKSHRDLFENVRESIGPDTAVDIITWCCSNLPLDEGWEVIGRRLELFPGIVDGEDMKCITYLRAIIDRVDQLGEPSIASEVPEDLVTEYISILGKRQSYIEETANILWSRIGQSDYEKKSRQNLIRTIIENMEPQLGMKSCIVNAADKLERVDIKDKADVIRFLNDLRKPYLNQWPTCLEYYVGTERKGCSESMLAVLLATLIVDCPNQTSYKTEISRKLEDFRDQLGEKAIDDIESRFDAMLNNLINPLEIDYAS